MAGRPLPNQGERIVPFWWLLGLHINFMSMVYWLHAFKTRRDGTNNTKIKAAKTCARLKQLFLSGHHHHSLEYGGSTRTSSITILRFYSFKTQCLSCTSFHILSWRRIFFFLSPKKMFLFNMSTLTLLFFNIYKAFT